MIDLPVYAIITESGMKHRQSGFVVTAEYARKFIFKRHYGTVENAV
jgi:hypothetical protein